MRFVAAVTSDVRRHLDGRRLATFGLESERGTGDVAQLGRILLEPHVEHAFFAGTADKSWYAINGYARETARRSFFGRIGYDYKSKYLFQALIRFDGSENFPAGKRWGIFPGVSVGWRISEEPFMKDNLPWLTNLKIRASYGEQGNDQIDPFQYMTTYG